MREDLAEGLALKAVAADRARTGDQGLEPAHGQRRVLKAVRDQSFMARRWCDLQLPVALDEAINELRLDCCFPDDGFRSSSAKSNIEVAFGVVPKPGVAIRCDRQGSNAPARKQLDLKGVQAGIYKIEVLLTVVELK